jgi:Winged helix DNA-binding domain
MAVATPLLERLQVNGVEYLMDPQTPERLDGCRKQARGVFLLPGFDEYMLGYADRSAALAAEFAERIVPGGNGMFRPTVVADGQVVGTWSHTGRGTDRTVLATPFTDFSTRVSAAIPRLHDALP